MLSFYNNENKENLKLGCTFPHLDINCLQQSSEANFHTFAKVDKDCMEQIREDNLFWLSIVFAPETIVDKTILQKSEIQWKSLIGIDASQF